MFCTGSFDTADVQNFPILPRLALGLFAPVAMHFIVIFGGEFYSGNCMCVCRVTYAATLTMI